MAPPLTSSSLVRIALLVLIGVVILEFIWAQFHDDSAVLREEWGLRGGCPAANTPRVVHGDADYEWQLRTVGGDETALHAFRNRVVFVNVWATWCGPCRDEMPSIQKLYDAMGKEGVAFVIVSEEEEETVHEFLSAHHYSFPAYISRGEIPSVFESRGIPATFVIDRDGQIVLRTVGSADWNDAACHTFLKSLL